MCSTITSLLEYVKDNRQLNWEDYDTVGFFGSTILLSKCSYPVKESAIELINIPIMMNRFAFIEMIKREVLGNIEPTLEDKIDKNIDNYW